MVIRYGKVVEFDSKKNVGVIRDVRGKDYFFTLDECESVDIRGHERVTFIKDEDFKMTNVACLVRKAA